MYKFLVLGAVVILSLAVTADATEYFLEDFDDGDVSDWTSLTPGYTPQAYAWPGEAGYDGTMIGASGVADATMSKSANPNMSGDIYWFSADFRHTGGYGGTGGASWRRTTTWFLDSQGQGIGLFIEAARFGGSMEIDAFAATIKGTDDYGATSFNFLSSGDQYAIVGGIDSATNDGWAKHLVEVKFDFELAEVSIYIDDVLLRWSNSVISWASDEDYMDFSEVRFHQRRTNTVDDYGHINVDNIYAGNVPIPEPATLSLLAVGGLAALRRRSL